MRALYAGPASDTVTPPADPSPAGPRTFGAYGAPGAPGDRPSPHRAQPPTPARRSPPLQAAATSAADRTDHVIVDDGAYPWAADRTELATALVRGGWTDDRDSIYGGRVLMPPPCDDDPTAPYNALCQAVTPTAGEGGARDLTAAEHDSLPRMHYDPANGGWDAPVSLAAAMRQVDRGWTGDELENWPH